MVHCSAGIGRTGSIVLIQHAIELLESKQPLLEISTYLLELRKQRNNSIQVGRNFVFTHTVYSVLKMFTLLEHIPCY